MAISTGYADVHQGPLYKKAVADGLIPVSFYKDGGNYTKSGRSECWVATMTLLDLPPKLRSSAENVVYCGIWFGTIKPDWDIFFDYVELSTLAQSIAVIQLIADIPARQSLLKLINVPGYFPCAKCTIRGDKKGKAATVYSSHVFELRRQLDFNEGDGPGMRGKCYLSDYVTLPDAITTDSMHTGLIGIIKDDTKRVFNGYENGPKAKKLSSDCVKQLNGWIENLKVCWPSEFERKLRPTTDFKHWKATEWKLWALFVIPTFLLKVLSSVTGSEGTLRRRQGLSMLKFSAALHLLVQNEVSNDDLATAKAILEDWYKERAKIWSPAAHTYKAHEMMHITDQIKVHGPLHKHSAFAGENIVGVVGRLISCKTSTVSAKQIRERLSLLRKTQEWARLNGDERVARAICNAPAFKGLEQFYVRESLCPSGTFWIEKFMEANCTSLKDMYMWNASLSTLQIDKEFFLNFVKAQSEGFQITIVMRKGTNLNRIVKLRNELLDEHFECVNLYEKKNVTICYGELEWYYILRAD
uniref:DUF659 domain-containing protein n=1 Tax=Panagrellus redivivus TaxID=6233 RepID=A0A7E4ZR20_PANRE